MTHYRQIGIIGSGRVAQALGFALAPHSMARVRLWGRSYGRAAAAAERIGAIPASRLDEAVRGCDLLAIAVADDALAAVITQLADVTPIDCTTFIFHVSGRSGAAILGPLQAAGALTAAIHPAMTFTGDPQSEVERMAQARFAVTGSSPDAGRRARDVIGRLGGVAVEIAEERRALYHAALCHASNHLVTLIADASQALERAGVDDPGALLAPLVRAALDNSLDRGFAALSGPLLRGDGETIRGHVDALTAHCPDLLPAYRAMAIATLDRLDGKAEIPVEALRRALDSAASVP